MTTIIDSVIILLLIGSIGYGYVVSCKVRVLMATLKELQPLVHEFSHAVEKSEISVHLMRQNIENAEKVEAEPVVETVAAEKAFTSQRSAPQKEIDTSPKMRVLRDKKELVKAFFENAPAARV